MAVPSMAVNTFGTPRGSVQPWVTLAVAWAALSGVLCALLALAFALTDIATSILGASFGDALNSFAPTPLAHIALTVALGAIAVAELASIPGLLSYSARGRVLSLAVNFIGFLITFSFAFRQFTVNSDVADPSLPTRLGMIAPVLPAVILFGLALYALWRKDVSTAYGETVRTREALTAYIYISPYLLTASIFTIFLLGYALFVSFTEFHQFDTPIWVGIQNYTEVFKDRLFSIGLSNVVWYVIVVVTFQTIVAIILAILMNGNFAFKRLFRTIFYMPSVTSSVVVSLIFLWLFNGRGFINQILINNLGLYGFLKGLGLRTPAPTAGGPNWLNIADRWGELTWLKPFYAGNGPLIIGMFIVLAGFFIAMRVVRAQQEGQGKYPTPFVAAATAIGSRFIIGVLIALAIYSVLIQLSLPVLQTSDQGAKDTFGMLMLQGPGVAFSVIMGMNIFTTAPTFMIMFLAALQDIPGQLYEAAKMDGANGLQRFWSVTLPMLRPVMLLVIVLGTIGTFQIFDQVKVMTQGGPLDTTTTPVYLIYTKALGSAQIAQVGYASAIAFVLGAIIFVFTFIQRRYIESGTQQY